MLSNSGLKLFSKYLLVGLSAMVLFFTAQQMQPTTVFAEVCQDKNTGAIIPCPVVAPAAPAPAAAPQSQITCYRCANASTCESYQTTGTSCSSNCDSCPNRPAAPSCTDGGLVRTDERCVGNQMCKINIHTNANCSQYEGGFYNCQNSAACGFQDRRGCNDVCTATSQCNNDDAGRACIGGRCRLSSNPSSENCSPPVAAPTRLGCNDACTSDSQCNNDDRGRACISGFCRLSSNPSSENCSPAVQVAVQPAVVAPAPAAPAPVVVQEQSTQPQNQTTTLQCPDGRTVVVAAGQNANMNVLCQSQQQQSNNNNVNTNVNTNVASAVASAQGGSTGPITVTVPQTTREVIREIQVTGNVGVATTAQVLGVQQLPKTGLPLAAWSALAFIPAGFRLRRFSQTKKELENHPSYIFENRQFTKES